MKHKVDPLLPNSQTQAWKAILSPQRKRRTRTKKHVQFVWWGWRWSFGARGPWPESGKIYRWRFCLGPLEIRRWA